MSTEPTAHLTKTSYGQCKCLWCGEYRSHLPCPVTNEVRTALAIYALQHGRSWKKRLRDAWADTEQELGLELQLAGVVLGPRGLDRVTPRMLDRHRILEKARAAGRGLRKRVWGGLP